MNEDKQNEDDDLQWFPSLLQLLNNHWSSIFNYDFFKQLNI